MLNTMLKQTGIPYLNGKQTPVTLYVLSKYNTTIAEIFKEGYTKTKLGQNPGLEAQMVSTAEAPQAEPSQDDPNVAKTP